MRLELRRMTLENFKGIKNRVIDFDSKLHRINGKNAFQASLFKKN